MSDKLESQIITLFTGEPGDDGDTTIYSAMLVLRKHHPKIEFSEIEELFVSVPSLKKTFVIKQLHGRVFALSKFFIDKVVADTNAAGINDIFVSEIAYDTTEHTLHIVFGSHSYPEECDASDMKFEEFVLNSGSHLVEAGTETLARKIEEYRIEKYSGEEIDDAERKNGFADWLTETYLEQPENYNLEWETYCNEQCEEMSSKLIFDLLNSWTRSVR